MSDNNLPAVIEDNKLIVVTNYPVAFSEHVRRIRTPIGDLKLEHRIVYECEMYSVVLCNLKIDQYGIRGETIISYSCCDDLSKKNQNEKMGILKVLQEARYGKNNDGPFILHDEKKYYKKWGNYTENERIIWHQRGSNPDIYMHEKYIGINKLDIMSTFNVEVSNELLLKLVDPLIDPLVKLYREISNF